MPKPRSGVTGTRSTCPPLPMRSISCRRIATANSVVALFPCARRSSYELRCQIESVHQSEFVRHAEAGRGILPAHAYPRLHFLQNHGAAVVHLLVIEIICTIGDRRL